MEYAINRPKQKSRAALIALRGKISDDLLEDMCKMLWDYPFARLESILPIIDEEIVVVLWNRKTQIWLKNPCMSIMHLLHPDRAHLGYACNEWRAECLEALCAYDDDICTLFDLVVEHGQNFGTHECDHLTRITPESLCLNPVLQEYLALDTMQAEVQKPCQQTQWWWTHMGARWVLVEILLVLYSFRSMENRYAKHCDSQLVLWGFVYSTDPSYSAKWELVIWWIFEGYRCIRALHLYSSRTPTTDIRSLLNLFNSEPQHLYLKLRIYVLLVTTAQFVLTLIPSGLGGCLYMVACVRGALMLIVYYTEFSTSKLHMHTN